MPSFLKSRKFITEGRDFNKFQYFLIRNRTKIFKVINTSGCVCLAISLLSLVLSATFIAVASSMEDVEARSGLLKLFFIIFAFSGAMVAISTILCLSLAHKFNDWVKNSFYLISEPIAKSRYSRFVYNLDIIEGRASLNMKKINQPPEFSSTDINFIIKKIRNKELNVIHDLKIEQIILVVDKLIYEHENKSIRIAMDRNHIDSMHGKMKFLTEENEKLKKDLESISDELNIYRSFLTKSKGKNGN